MTRNCLWCEKPFTPRVGTKNYYGLGIAGTDICWNCSDLWQDKMVELHSEHIIGWMDPSSGKKVVTQTGHVLPLHLGDRETHRYRTDRAPAVDIYGKNWNAGFRDNLITLKPAA